MRAVHVPEQITLVLLEAVIPKRDGVFDDVKGAPLVLMRRDLQVRAQPDPHFFAALQIGYFTEVERLSHYFPVLLSASLGFRPLSSALSPVPGAGVAGCS